MVKVSTRSSGASTYGFAAGSSTSNTPVDRRLRASINGYACACAVFCAREAGGKGEDAGPTTKAGQMPTLQSAGCSLASQHVRKPSVRENGKTINSRAVCGRSACTVRREGKRSIRFPYPYSFQQSSFLVRYSAVQQPGRHKIRAVQALSPTGC